LNLNTFEFACSHAVSCDTLISLNDEDLYKVLSTDVQAAVNIPVLVGSGVTVDNVHEYKHASGLIIGSHFKKDGQWKNEVDPLRMNKFMDKIKVLRDESE